MDTLRAVAHLQRELGDNLFKALISSDHTATVRKFAKELLVASLPTSMTIGDRTYDILSFLRESETSVKGQIMVERAVEMDANLGREDGQYLLDHQQDIPKVLRGKVIFVFTGWRHPIDTSNVYLVYWNDLCWVENWNWLGNEWYHNARVLRPK